MKRSVLSRITVVSIIVCAIGAIISIIYNSSIYNAILTAVPLWMINGLILSFWVILIAIVLIIYFVLKKHTK